eukprot:gnl/TRDRNA2_/TRDRNA2_160324_c0_seq3.p1 gnl/TRDRNA2_/TRDRNA2_160324_c0~~gnl/TRDRNA2_/TRDRNA2_160324_c0_seq3.p1  ORF type:complete len:154 (+),score=33.86 gnl/TRDRNA2_/TRDRNA2_160324_c0_seq3:26-487(+)
MLMHYGFTDSTANPQQNIFFDVDELVSAFAKVRPAVFDSSTQDALRTMLAEQLEDSELPSLAYNASRPAPDAKFMEGLNILKKLTEQLSGADDHNASQEALAQMLTTRLSEVRDLLRACAESESSADAMASFVRGIEGLLAAEKAWIETALRQ